MSRETTNVSWFTEGGWKLHKTSKSNKTKRQQQPVSLPFDCQSTNKRAEVKVLDAKTQSLLGKQCYKTNVIKSQQAQGQKRNS